MDPLIGRTLRDGDYELREVIAVGGMATVYRAYARPLKTDVAIKVLAPRLAADLSFRERFQEEAASMARTPMHHPNLVEVHWFGEEGELVYIVMRLVSGGSLRDRLRAPGGRLDLVSTARLVQQVADALQLAHDNGLVHLDVKPANILLGRADWPLLTDFGITRAIKHQVTQAGRPRPAGTPAYMSPEQCRGDEVDGRSDQYSLAATAYELLTGEQPFQAETTDALLNCHLQAAPRRPRELNPGLPGPVEEVLLRGLAKSPAQRFASVRDFGTALSEAVERARGISLESKTAAAATAPNLLSVLALLVGGPLLLAMLPVGNLFGRLPLAWPFQLLLATAIGALLLGIRWHLIGLIGRALGSTLEALDRLGRSSVTLGTGPSGHLGGWRNKAVGCVEGLVNLVYLFAMYRLVGQPAMAVLGSLADAPVYRAANTGLALLVAGATFGIVAAVYRASGAFAAVLGLTLGWAAVEHLFATSADLPGGAALTWMVQLVVGGGLLAILLSRRRQLHAALGSLTVSHVSPLLVGAVGGFPAPATVAASQAHLTGLMAGVADVGYLLVADAVLATPFMAALAPLVGLLAAAILLTGLAGLALALLLVRLHAAAGVVGAALGALLAAPLLLSLPLLDVRVSGATWPASAAAWVVGAAILLLLAIVRSRARALAELTLGARLERTLLGTQYPRTPEEAAVRVGALGGVAAALFDVGCLVVAYWVVGVPLASMLVRSTGQAAMSSLVLGGVLAAALGLLVLPSYRAAAVLEATGDRWRRRGRTLMAVGLVAAALVVALGATPSVLATPSATGGLALEPIQVPVVSVERDFWLPWQPRPDEATHALDLVCSDGRGIGHFREVVRPASAARMPAGPAGPLGSTGVPCDQWRSLYAARRHAAGLGDEPSFSWEWLDVAASVNADRSIDVVETHRVLFTAGRHHDLTWSLGDVRGADVSGLRLWDGEAWRDLRTWESNGQLWVGWTLADDAIGPDERTYTLAYHLANDQHEANHLFDRLVLSADRPEPVWRTTVRVRLPDGIDPRKVGLSSDGAAVRGGMLDEHSVWFDTADVPGYTPLRVAVDLNMPRPPTDPPPPAPTPTPIASMGVPTPPPTPILPPPPATPAPELVIATTAEPTPIIDEPAQPTATPTPGAAATAEPVATPPVAEPEPSPLVPVVPPADPPPPAQPSTAEPSTPTPEVTPMPDVTPTLPAPTPEVIPSVAPTTTSATATPGRCPDLRITSLEARASGNSIVVDWTSAGGCDPYTGRLTAEYTYASVSREQSVSSASGSLTDSPARGCGAINYTLNLADRGGQRVSASTSASHTDGCSQGSTTSDPDKTPPVASAAPDRPEPASGWYTAPVSVGMSATDQGGSGVQSITYSATGGQTLASTTVGGASASLAVSSPGQTTLSYFATDKAGNAGTLQNLSLRIDAQAPTSLLVSPSADEGGDVRLSRLPATLSFKASDQAGGSGVQSLTVSATGVEGGQTLPPSATRGDAASLTLSEAAAGITQVTFFATDAAGNQEAPNTLRVIAPLPIPTHTGVTCSSKGLALGEPTSCTATVAADSGAATPGGPVVFTVNGDRAPADCALQPTAVARVATCSASYIPAAVGQQAIGARYAGQAPFVGSASDSAFFLSVSKRTTTTALSCVDRTIEIVNLNCTVTVTDTSAGQSPSAPRGSVSLSVVRPENGRLSRSSCELASGSCSFDYAGGDAPHLKATYNGDGSHAPSEGSLDLPSRIPTPTATARPAPTATPRPAPTSTPRPSPTATQGDVLVVR